jgi:NAD(P)-dependent dehydrogenase (short-subunit alcohol dehydrogenase family)
MEFDGVRALVTGGASGIGAAAVTVLHERGGKVAVLDRTVPGSKGGALMLQCDITDDDAVRIAVGEAARLLGGIDVLVNNAGIGAAGTIEDNDDQEWHSVFDVNVVGMVRVTRAAMPYLRQSQQAAIVNTCSAVAAVGLPSRALYSATKGAVLALTRAMAADHLREGIRVNCVSPGTADTPWIGRLLAAADDPEKERAALEARQPTGRLVSAREVAEAIAYLASRQAGAITGTNLQIDGGLAALRLPD